MGNERYIKKFNGGNDNGEIGGKRAAKNGGMGASYGRRNGYSKNDGGAKREASQSFGGYKNNKVKRAGGNSNYAERRGKFQKINNEATDKYAKTHTEDVDDVIVALDPELDDRSETLESDSFEQLTAENCENIVAGRNAVAELVRSERDVDKIFVKDGEWNGSIKKIVFEAKERGIPIVSAGKTKLDSLAGNIPHQGIVAIAAEKQYCTVEDIIEYARSKGEEPFIVIADGINDPHNLGTLIRVADGAGCHGLIIPKRRNATLTPTVGKASAGALSHLMIARASSISATVDKLKKLGVWVYSAEAGGSDYSETEIATPAAFVFGSEGEGVSRAVKGNSDVIISIPMRGHVNSLNVSSAAAVILFHAAKYF